MAGTLAVQNQIQAAIDATVQAQNQSSAPAYAPEGPEGAYPVVEDFDSMYDFTLSGLSYDNQDGRLKWVYSRSGGEQFAYSQIPEFSGDVKLTVVGLVDGWTNNCSIGVGIGDSAGEGVAVRFGSYGGGCSTGGALINAGGVSLDMEENTSCHFTGNWPWIETNRMYTAVLTIEDGYATLDVSNGVTASGYSNYSGEYSYLWIGGYGDGDYPVCNGELDYVKIEPLY